MLEALFAFAVPTLVFLSATTAMSTSSGRVLGLGAVILAAGAAGFHEIPGMIASDAPGSKLVNAFYCSAITLTTVGYGDICPSEDTGPEGKAFLIVLSFLGLGFFCGPLLDFAASWTEQVPGGPGVVAAVTIGVGVALFTQPLLWDGKQGLAPLDAVYYATVTGTTIGYGDHSPSTDEGKIAAATYAIIAVNAVGGLLAPAFDFLSGLVAGGDEGKVKGSV